MIDAKINPRTYLLVKEVLQKLCGASYWIEYAWRVSETKDQVFECTNKNQKDERFTVAIPYRVTKLKNATNAKNEIEKVFHRNPK